MSVETLLKNKDYFKPLPELNALMDLFVLDKSNGLLKWKKLGRGKKPGWLKPQSTGYITVRINGVLYAAHRILYKIYTGNDPGKYVVDHIDGDKSNNKPENLRLADRSENGANRTKLERRNTTGAHGVSVCGTTGKYKVRCVYKGQEYWGGRYKRLDEAENASRELRRSVYGEWSPNL